MSITIRRDGTAGTRHILKIRNHEIPVDASAAGGGSDAGPQPHDLYDASLAACKALTVLIYARRKGIPVEDIEVVVDRDDSEERKGTYRLKSGPLQGDREFPRLARRPGSIQAGKKQRTAPRILNQTLETNLEQDEAFRPS